MDSALALWIADASVPGAQLTRRAALRSDWDLAQVAAGEGLIEGAPQGYGRFARFLAQLAEDGWLRFDYQRFPGDGEPPPAQHFDELLLAGPEWSDEEGLLRAAATRSALAGVACGALG
jgi:hypothetical protein